MPFRNCWRWDSGRYTVAVGFGGFLVTGFAGFAEPNTRGYHIYGLLWRCADVTLGRSLPGVPELGRTPLLLL